MPHAFPNDLKPTILQNQENLEKSHNGLATQPITKSPLQRYIVGGKIAKYFEKVESKFFWSSLILIGFITF